MLDCKLKCIRRDRHTVPTRIRMHAHGSNELTYFISGKGSTQIGECVYPYRNKSFAFYRAGTAHDENAPVPCQTLWMHFTFSVEGVELREGVFEDPNGELLVLVQKLRTLSLARDAYREVLIESCLGEVIAVAARLQSGGASLRRETDWQAVASYMDENSNTEVDFAALAAGYGYSYDRFRHLFCEKFGLPPHAYLLRQRIEHARYMLEHTTLSLTDVAFDCGFGSSSQFSSLFRKHVGVTPGEYRRRFLPREELGASGAPVEGDMP